MPNQTYRCPVEEHGEFDHFVSLGESPPPSMPCPVCRTCLSHPGHPQHEECGQDSPWMPPTVAVIWNCPK